MERAVREDEKEMYNTMLKISQRVEIMYKTLQKETRKGAIATSVASHGRGLGRIEAQQTEYSNRER